ncbi:hypothetical protein LB524_08170 [Mesorhizobium sp. ESP6-5]|uniref:hypothetical protein n=1 Tax=Mesorhizobium sp. ESP6-5 TaxID=2876623 RepID=UPI001CCC1A69|nr:hypothetical protein [Mesorhizobium sp. ESP6-5]MBZ9755259.1 hypothetical protein [Mesorhizobium sp. ESP6-5]
MKLSDEYLLRYQHWQSRRISESNEDWDVRPWLKSTCAAFEEFVLKARGREIEQFQDFGAWKAVLLFENLAFFGLYGAVLEEPEPEDARRIIELGLQDGEKMVALGDRPSRSVPGFILDLAASRRALDEGHGSIDPTSLATFAGLSVGRVHNLMSGKDAQFASENGRIPVEQAAAWLAGRSAFWPSIWQEPKDAADTSERFRVPVASDGTIFHPGLRRRSGFMVGEKGSERLFDTFDQALAALHEIREPRWRRPNAQGNWGIVKATGWTFITKKELNTFRP